MIGWNNSRFDDSLRGSTGEYDSGPATVFLGAIVPSACVGIAISIVIVGGVTLPGRNGYPGVYYHGLNAVCSSVTFVLGIACLLVANYLLPNVFRQSYGYQYVAAVGVVMAIGGMLWFCVAALV